MKIRQKNQEGESRELLLKEYFLNAYLIALLKQAGAGMKRRADHENKQFAENGAKAGKVAEQN